MSDLNSGSSCLCCLQRKSGKWKAEIFQRRGGERVREEKEEEEEQEEGVGREKEGGGRGGRGGRGGGGGERGGVPAVQCVGLYHKFEQVMH